MKNPLNAEVGTCVKKTLNSPVKLFNSYPAEMPLPPLRILPDKEGRKGIDVLTGKGKLANYPDDYQIGESLLAFEELLDIFQKNKGRLGVSLSDAGVVERARKEYEGSVERRG